LTPAERTILIADARLLKPTPRLEALLGRIDALTRQLNEARAKISELAVKLNEERASVARLKYSASLH
jgi:hypothetical protein